MYSYAMLMHNSESVRNTQTFLPTKHKKTKYAVMYKTVHKDWSETITHIKYGNDLETLQNDIKTYPSWYDYVNKLTKNIQGYVTEL